MPKNMTNIDIREYEGGDFAKIEDNYTDRQVQVAIANRAEKLIERIKTLENNPDVVDIVATYADLQAYDTASLTDKDIIRVLEDSTHEGNSTYYRWNATTNQFDFVGEIAGGTEYTAGDGIDITNDVIKATNTGKARVLTTADYNWPTTGTKTSVAIWLLDAGLYYIPTDAPVSVQYGAGLGGNSNAKDQMFLVGPTRTSSFKKDVLELDNQSSIRFIRYSYADGRGYVVHLDSPVDNLNSNDSIYALSAKQGKVLKGLIDSIAIRGAGAPTTSTVGEVGQLYEDGTNGALYQLKSIDITVTPNIYNWEQVGAGGGGITELTTADMDYPDNNPTGVALWRLDPGVYSISSDAFAGVANTSGELSSLITQSVIVVAKYSSSATSIVTFDILAGTSWMFRTATATGAKGTVYRISPNIVQATGNSQTDVMSQNAVTSMVFADPSTKRKVQIGVDANAGGDNAVSVGRATYANNYGVAIGQNAHANTSTCGIAIGGSPNQFNPARADGIYSIAIGGGDYNNNGAYITSYGSYAIAIGTGASTAKAGSIALGPFSTVTSVGEMNIGSTSTSYGYNSSNYRLLSGLYDGQSAHDAATVGQVNSVIDAINTALSTNIPHIGA